MPPRKKSKEVSLDAFHAPAQRGNNKPQQSQKKAKGGAVLEQIPVEQPLPPPNPEKKPHPKQRHDKKAGDLSNSNTKKGDHKDDNKPKYQPYWPMSVTNAYLCPYSMPLPCHVSPAKFSAKAGKIEPNALFPASQDLRLFMENPRQYDDLHAKTPQESSWDTLFRLLYVCGLDELIDARRGQLSYPHPKMSLIEEAARTQQLPYSKALPPFPHQIARHLQETYGKDSRHVDVDSIVRDLGPNGTMLEKNNDFKSNVTLPQFYPILMEGSIRILNRDKFAFVQCPGFPVDILVNQHSLNRAFPSDVVICRLSSYEQWRVQNLSAVKVKGLPKPNGWAFLREIPIVAQMINSRGFQQIVQYEYLRQMDAWYKAVRYGVVRSSSSSSQQQHDEDISTFSSFPVSDDDESILGHIMSFDGRFISGYTEDDITFTSDRDQTCYTLDEYKSYLIEQMNEYCMNASLENDQQITVLMDKFNSIPNSQHARRHEIKTQIETLEKEYEALLSSVDRIDWDIILQDVVAQYKKALAEMVRNKENRVDPTSFPTPIFQSNPVQVALKSGIDIDDDHDNDGNNQDSNHQQDDKNPGKNKKQSNSKQDASGHNSNASNNNSNHSGAGMPLPNYEHIIRWYQGDYRRLQADLEASGDLVFQSSGIETDDDTTTDNNKDSAKKENKVNQSFLLSNGLPLANPSVPPALAGDLPVLLRSPSQWYVNLLIAFLSFCFPMLSIRPTGTIVGVRNHFGPQMKLPESISLSKAFSYWLQPSGAISTVLRSMFIQKPSLFDTNYANFDLPHAYHRIPYATFKLHDKMVSRRPTSLVTYQRGFNPVYTTLFWTLVDGDHTSQPDQHASTGVFAQESVRTSLYPSIPPHILQQLKGRERYFTSAYVSSNLFDISTQQWTLALNISNLEFFQNQDLQRKQFMEWLEVYSKALESIESALEKITIQFKAQDERYPSVHMPIKYSIVDSTDDDVLHKYCDLFHIPFSASTSTSQQQDVLIPLLQSSYIYPSNIMVHIDGMEISTLRLQAPKLYCWLVCSISRVHTLLELIHTKRDIMTPIIQRLSYFFNFEHDGNDKSQAWESAQQVVTKTINSLTPQQQRLLLVVSTPGVELIGDEARIERLPRQHPLHIQLVQRDPDENKMHDDDGEFDRTKLSIYNTPQDTDNQKTSDDVPPDHTDHIDDNQNTNGDDNDDENDGNQDGPHDENHEHGKKKKRKRGKRGQAKKEGKQSGNGDDDEEASIVIHNYDDLLLLDPNGESLQLIDTSTNELLPPTQCEITPIPSPLHAFSLIESESSSDFLPAVFMIQFSAWPHQSISPSVNLYNELGGLDLINSKDKILPILVKHNISHTDVFSDDIENELFASLYHHDRAQYIEQYRQNEQEQEQLRLKHAKLLNKKQSGKKQPAEHQQQQHQQQLSAATVPNPKWFIPQDELNHRADLRDRLIFTVDPITAKDLDDALSVEYIGLDTELDCGLTNCTGKAVFRIGVHIADVGYFVRSHTLLDAEATNRSTSVYLTQFVVPMLPRILSEDLCSLNPAQDRLAFSCFFLLDEDGQVRSVERRHLAKHTVRYHDGITEPKQLGQVIPSKTASGKVTGKQGSGDGNDDDDDIDADIASLTDELSQMKFHTDISDDDGDDDENMDKHILSRLTVDAPHADDKQSSHKKRDQQKAKQRGKKQQQDDHQAHHLQQKGGKQQQHPQQQQQKGGKQKQGHHHEQQQQKGGNKQQQPQKQQQHQQQQHKHQDKSGKPGQNKHDQHDKKGPKPNDRHQGKQGGRRQNQKHRHGDDDEDMIKLLKKSQVKNKNKSSESTRAISPLEAWERYVGESAWYGKSIIRSAVKLDYGIVQDLVSVAYDDPLYDDMIDIRNTFVSETYATSDPRYAQSSATTALTASHVNPFNVRDIVNKIGLHSDEAILRQLQASPELYEAFYGQNGRCRPANNCSIYNKQSSLPPEDSNNTTGQQIVADIVRSSRLLHSLGMHRREDRLGNGGSLTLDRKKLRFRFGYEGEVYLKACGVNVQEYYLQLQELDEIKRYKEEHLRVTGSDHIDEDSLAFKRFMTHYREKRRFIEYHLNKTVQSMGIEQSQDTNMMIEEYMLLANIHVARRVYRLFPTQALLRNHPDPHENASQTAALLRKLGVNIDNTSSATTQSHIVAIGQLYDQYTQDYKFYLENIGNYTDEAQYWRQVNDPMYSKAFLQIAKRIYHAKSHLKLVVTEMLAGHMRPAKYFCTGTKVADQSKPGDASGKAGHKNDDHAHGSSGKGGAKGQHGNKGKDHHHIDKNKKNDNDTKQPQQPKQDPYIKEKEWQKFFHHYALNFDYYTHFTSPIRRYPDIVVHRLLEASFTVEPPINTLPFSPIYNRQSVPQELLVVDHGHTAADAVEEQSTLTHDSVTATSDHMEDNDADEHATEPATTVQQQSLQNRIEYDTTVFSLVQLQPIPQSPTHYYTGTSSSLRSALQYLSATPAGMISRDCERYNERNTHAKYASDESLDLTMGELCARRYLQFKDLIRTVFFQDEYDSHNPSSLLTPGNTTTPAFVNDICVANGKRIFSLDTQPDIHQNPFMNHLGELIRSAWRMYKPTTALSDPNDELHIVPQEFIQHLRVMMHRLVNTTMPLLNSPLYLMYSPLLIETGVIIGRNRHAQQNEFTVYIARLSKTVHIQRGEILGGYIRQGTFIMTDPSVSLDQYTTTQGGSSAGDGPADDNYDELDADYQQYEEEYDRQQEEERGLLDKASAVGGSTHRILKKVSKGRSDGDKDDRPQPKSTGSNGGNKNDRYHDIDLDTMWLVEWSPAMAVLGYYNWSLKTDIRNPHAPRAYYDELDKERAYDAKLSSSSTASKLFMSTTRLSAEDSCVHSPVYTGTPWQQPQKGLVFTSMDGETMTEFQPYTETLRVLDPVRIAFVPSVPDMTLKAFLIPRSMKDVQQFT